MGVPVLGRVVWVRVLGAVPKFYLLALSLGGCWYVAVPALFLFYRAGAKKLTMTMYRFGHGFGALLMAGVGVGVVTVVWVRTDSYGSWFRNYVV